MGWYLTLRVIEKCTVSGGGSYVINIYIIYIYTPLTKILGDHPRHTEKVLHGVDMAMDRQLHLVHITEGVELDL